MTRIHYEVHTIEGERVRAGSGGGDIAEWDADLAAKEQGAPVVLTWGYTDDPTTWQATTVEPDEPWRTATVEP